MTIEKRRQYESYDQYTDHQKKKSESKRIRRKLEKKFVSRVKKFEGRLRHLSQKKIIGGKALCLGARMGEEVQALINIGLDAIGIDLVPNEPLVVVGDFNNMEFETQSFDVIYTNAFDHAWDADCFFKEACRVLKDDGIFVIDVFPEERNFGDYEVIFIGDANDVVKLVEKKFGLKLVSTHRNLPNLYLSSHKEIQLVFKKEKTK